MRTVAKALLVVSGRVRRRRVRTDRPGPAGRGGSAHPSAGVLQDRRLPALLDRRGHRRDPATRLAERVRRHRDRGRRPVHHRQPGAVPGRRLALHHRRRAQRHPADRVRVLHPRRRRVRRRARRGRHRVRLALVRRAGRRLLRLAPGATSRPRVRVEDRAQRLDRAPAVDLDPHRRVVQLPHQPARHREGARQPGRVVLQRRHHGRRPPDHLVPELPRRPRLVHRPRPHRGVLHRPELHPHAARRHPDRRRRARRRLPPGDRLHPDLRRHPGEPGPVAPGRPGRLHPGRRHADLPRRHGPAVVPGAARSPTTRSRSTG